MLPSIIACQYSSSAHCSAHCAYSQWMFLCCRQSVLKWNGWGYRDSRFIVNERGQAQFNGKRSEFVVCIAFVKEPRFVPPFLLPLLPPSLPLPLPLSLSPSLPHPLRYEIGGQEMPLMREWMEKKFGLDLSLASFSQVRCLGNQHCTYLHFVLAMLLCMN